MPTDNTVSVKQLNLYVKSLIEGDKRLNFISVAGEISNFKNHYASGHWYFTLKDSEASVRCVMFKASASRVNFALSDGMSVVVSGRISLYEKDGQYQFYAEKIAPLGEGSLSLAFRITKEKLEKEGLFDESSKRPLNKRPKKVAVVTSDTGAAVKDICSTFKSRYPICELIICPVSVQGVNSVSSIIKTLDCVYKMQGIDTVILGRGGGSAEDLSPFNDEALARKVYESPFPVISAVGHETDFTICDFVADVRAATPTAAAVLATTDINEIKNQISDLKFKLTDILNLKTQNLSLNLKIISNRLQNPTEIINEKLQKIEFLKSRVLSLTDKKLNESEHGLSKSVSELDKLSPLKTLSRGFAVAAKDGFIITNADDVNIGDDISVLLKKGSLKCNVKEKSDGKV